MAEKFNVVMGEMAPFCRTADALKWARSHGLIGRMEDLETGGKGDYLSDVVLEGVRRILCAGEERTEADARMHKKAMGYELTEEVQWAIQQGNEKIMLAKEIAKNRTSAFD